MDVEPIQFDSTVKRQQWCRRILAIGGLLLIAATKPLWFSLGEFPQVPWFEVLCPTPQWADWTLSGGLVISLLAMAVFKADSKWNLIAGWSQVALFAALIALNQHRLQPWAWFIMLGTIATSARSDYSLRWMRVLIFGVYFFSGLSKLEPTFVNGGGDWLLDGLLKLLGQSSRNLTVESRRIALYLMPLAELVTAFLVIVPRFRRIGFFAVLAMHGVLILAVGPLGLNHKPGVLLWNGMFQALAFPLLWSGVNEVREKCNRSRLLGVPVVIAAILLPCCGQRWAPVVDQWPSWSVYSTWSHRMKVFPAWGEASLAEVRLDQRSLDSTGAPMYPQNRFRLGVVRASGYDYVWGLNRRSMEEAADIASEFWFNTKPRIAEPDQPTD